MADRIAEYRRMAALGQFQGLTVLAYEKELGQLCKNVGATVLLDYGSGHGHAWRSHNMHRRIGIKAVQCYDPAIPAFATKPTGKAPAVCCVDMLEHLPEDEVDSVIAELFSLAGKCLFATVCCREAKKSFSDGINLHLTVKPFDWWLDKFETAAVSGIKWVLLETP